jgi:hypothetical protein
LVIGDTWTKERVTVHLGSIRALAWLDDNTLLVKVGARGVIVVDASTGRVIHEPDLPFDSRGLGVVGAPA